VVGMLTAAIATATVISACGSGSSNGSSSGQSASSVSIGVTDDPAAFGYESSSGTSYPLLSSIVPATR